MGNREKLLLAINQASGPICDDCLTKHVGLRQRQQAHARCTELKQIGAIDRSPGVCTVCAKSKIVNWRLAEATEQLAATAQTSAVASGAPGATRPWYWEGNVQNRIVEYLIRAGYRICHTADTASREAGKDIVAVGPDTRELWVSVKGFPTPKGSTNVQARHWFARAVFDLVLYRGENPVAELAIGLPAGYKTYQSLAQRVGWFRQSLPFKIFWVSEDGQVEVS